MEVVRKKIKTPILRTIIIDDEEHQRLSLRRMLMVYCSKLEVVAQADGVHSGLEAIQKYKPDLVLLDIQLADGNAYTLLEQLAPLNFQVIFITAFEKYTRKTSRYTRLNYLLKPIDPDELVEVVGKAVALRRIPPGQKVKGA